LKSSEFMCFSLTFGPRVALGEGIGCDGPNQLTCLHHQARGPFQCLSTAPISLAIVLLSPRDSKKLISYSVLGINLLFGRQSSDIGSPMRRIANNALKKVAQWWLRT
jgi:hypothetical protein